MLTLTFSLERMSIVRVDRNRVVAGSHGYVEARFIDRGNDWHAPITAMFNGIPVLLDDNMECLVPEDTIKEPGIVKVSAFSADLLTSNYVEFTVEQSGLNPDEFPDSPGQTWFAQISSIAYEAKATAYQTAMRAERGDFKGDKGDTGATGPQGEQGEKGDPGYTPQRGVDYWTEEDVAPINTALADVREAIKDTDHAAGDANSAAETALSAANAASSAAALANSVTVSVSAVVDRAENAVTDATNAVETAAQAVEGANTAIGNANTAVKNASDAATAANTAAESANSAASAANTAAGEATTAKNAANTAAESAASAAGSANTAASSANDKADAANKAAAAANTAAETAGSAAEAATNAASSANTAAESANTSAGAADEATTAANSAATAANDAADRANQLAHKLDTTYSREEIDALFGIGFNGGETYYDVMREFYAINGAEDLDDLTEITERWYLIGRHGWTGGTRFAQPDKSSASTGEKIGDNAGLVCEPSTNTTAGRDDYALLPLFAVCDCNWELDAQGKRHITAINGISSGLPFETGNAARPVGVLQMTPWTRYAEDEDYYSYEFTDEIGKAGFAPVPEAVDLDGTVHSFVLHAKYGFGDAYSSIANVPICVWDISHNTQRTAIPQKFNANSYYCGKCSCDDAWLKLHCYIKYASLTLDNIMNGCCSYKQDDKHPAVAETGVKRIIVTVAEGNALLVGSTICVGKGKYAAKADQCSVVDRAKIISIEDVEIDSTAYKAVNLDIAAPINTTTDLYWSTVQWWTGSTDDVLGNDGSPYSNTSNKEPYKLQGIEQSYGCYEVMADTILTYASMDGSNVLTMNVCRDATQFATSPTANYKRAAYTAPCPASAGWQYVKKLGHDPVLPELMFAEDIGGSSSTYTKDGLYILNAASGNYEWLALGLLDTGLANTGLSCALANYGLPGVAWFIGGRLSANGSRGEYNP